MAKCKYHCERSLCDDCRAAHWHGEVSALSEMRDTLDECTGELRAYVAAKRAQCVENVKKSQQTKKFVNMTMQQIKRKFELELEKKRDEMYTAIDSFVNSQKRQARDVLIHLDCSSS